MIELLDLISTVDLLAMFFITGQLQPPAQNVNKYPHIKLPKDSSVDFNDYQYNSSFKKENMKLADGNGKTPDVMMQRLEYSFYMQELNTLISKFGDAYPKDLTFYKIETDKNGNKFETPVGTISSSKKLTNGKNIDGIVNAINALGPKDVLEILLNGQAESGKGRGTGALDFTAAHTWGNHSGTISSRTDDINKYFSRGIGEEGPHMAGGFVQREMDLLDKKDHIDTVLRKEFVSLPAPGTVPSGASPGTGPQTTPALTPDQQAKMYSEILTKLVPEAYELNKEIFLNNPTAPTPEAILTSLLSKNDKDEYNLFRSSAFSSNSFKDIANTNSGAFKNNFFGNLDLLAKNPLMQKAFQDAYVGIQDLHNNARGVFANKFDNLVTEDIINNLNKNGTEEYYNAINTLKNGVITAKLNGGKYEFSLDGTKLNNADTKVAALQKVGKYLATDVDPREYDLREPTARKITSDQAAILFGNYDDQQKKEALVAAHRQVYGDNGSLVNGEFKLNDGFEDVLKVLKSKHAGGSGADVSKTLADNSKLNREKFLKDREVIDREVIEEKMKQEIPMSATYEKSMEFFKKPDNYDNVIKHATDEEMKKYVNKYYHATDRVDVSLIP